MSMDRRRFLQGGFAIGAHSLFGHPALRLVEAIANDGVRQALAADAGSGLLVRNYMNIGFFGGPLRYAFDAWLRTNDSDGALMFNPMTGTSFTNAGGTVNGLQYKTIAYKGLNVPAIFGQSVVTSAGSVPLTNYLDQMLVIRGYGTGVDGHPQNFNLQQRPLAGQPSISGISADGSANVFESVQYPSRGGYGSFASLKGVALNVLGGSKPVHSMMDGISSSVGTRALRTKYADAMDEAKARMSAMASTATKNGALARKSLDNAMGLIKKGVGDLDGYWNEAYNRYYNIIHTAMRTEGIVGINDVPVVTHLGAADQNYNTYFLADANQRLLDPSIDARNIWKTVTMGSLAEGLALAEYAYGNNLVSALEISVDQPSNLTFKENGAAALTNQTAAWDMHGTGAYTSLLMMNGVYRGLMAGLLELRTKLSAKNGTDGNSVWSNTVVQIMGDFNRAARGDGAGADHGFNQMCTSLFSGVFDGPEVVGNVMRDTGDGYYTGSQGKGASIDGYNQSGIPNAAAMASTVFQLLNAPTNPWANVASPLINLSGRKIVPIYGRGKVVG